MSYEQEKINVKEKPKKVNNKGRKKEKLPAGKAIKIRLYPTQDQRTKLNQWFGTAR